MEGKKEGREDGYIRKFCELRRAGEEIFIIIGRPVVSAFTIILQEDSRYQRKVNGKREKKISEGSGK